MLFGILLNRNQSGLLPVSASLSRNSIDQYKENVLKLACVTRIRLSSNNVMSLSHYPDIEGFPIRKFSRLVVCLFVFDLTLIVNSKHGLDFYFQCFLVLGFFCRK